MGILSFLKSGGKAAENVTAIAKNTIDGIGTWIDERDLTPEEVIKLTQQGMDLWIRVQESLAKESTVRSITRRYIACGILAMFFAIVIFAIAMYRFDKEWALFALSMIKDTPLGWLTAGVGVIYLGLQWQYSKK